MRIAIIGETGFVGRHTTAVTSGDDPPFRISSPRFGLPVMRGMIDRRMLVNFRCEPAALARLLPAQFRPKLHRGSGIGGICLIRLKGLRPPYAPAALGISSENAAHRIAVEWDENGEQHEGVFIPRRDTDSLLNRLVGGRLFPGFHHAAEFCVRETNDRFDLQMRSDDGATFISIAARVADRIPAESLFRTLDEASTFFRNGAVGWSVRPRREDMDGLKLHCPEWRMEPLLVERVETSFFADRDLFPPGAAEFDSAFVMRGLPHEWRARGRLIAGPKHELV